MKYTIEIDTEKPTIVANEVLVFSKEKIIELLNYITYATSKIINEQKQENEQLKDLLEKYREAVRKCLTITFMGAGCDVHSIAQYSFLVDKYLTEVEGLAFWKN